MLDFGVAKGGKEAAHSRVFVEEDWAGVKEFVWFDADGNPVGIQHESDPTAVLDANRRSRNDGTRGFTKSREMQKVATIPIDVLSVFCAVKGMPYHWAYGGPGQMEAIKAILKDPDFSYLRTDK